MYITFLLIIGNEFNTCTYNNQIIKPIYLVIKVKKNTTVKMILYRMKCNNVRHCRRLGFVTRYINTQESVSGGDL